MKNGAAGSWGLLALAVGVLLAGWFVGSGFRQGRESDRYVTVKGVSERDVKADLALWPLSFVATDNDLGAAQAQVGAGHDQVVSFLQRQGIDPRQAEVRQLEVTDLLANPYRSGPVESRYIIAETLMVRSENPQTVASAAQNIGELVKQGVVLSSQGGRESVPTFLFTRLNDHKPEMIAEATAEARKAAEQFAKDSGSALGGIRRASQGVFEILPRDRAPGIMEGSQIDKTLRVVSTVEYDLK